jgi:hypothetical protein
MQSDLRAFAAGFVLFVALSVVYLSATSGRDSLTLPGWLVSAAFYGAPILAGGVCGTLAPRHPLNTLLALGIAAAATFIGLELAWAQWGRTLKPGGMSSIGAVAAASTLIIPLLVLLSGIVGLRLRNRFTG